MSHASHQPNTGSHADEEYSLPCAEALLAGTLALMTGYVQACCDSHRDAMGRKIAANLQMLADAQGFTPHFRTVVWSLQGRWDQQCKARQDVAASSASAQGRLYSSSQWAPDVGKSGMSGAWLMVCLLDGVHRDGLCLKSPPPAKRALRGQVGCRRR